MLKAKIVKENGHGVRGTIHFQAECRREITPERAKAAQTELGFMPAGYGFENFKVVKCPVLLRFKATWTCQASCD